MDLSQNPDGHAKLFYTSQENKTHRFSGPKNASMFVLNDIQCFNSVPNENMRRCTHWPQDSRKQPLPKLNVSFSGYVQLMLNYIEPVFLLNFEYVFCRCWQPALSSKWLPKLQSSIEKLREITTIGKVMLENKTYVNN